MILLTLKKILRSRNALLIILFSLVAFDILFVALHINLGKDLIFNLDWEWNYPTYYQSIKLFLVGTLALYFLVLNKFNFKSRVLLLFWIVFSGFGLFLAFDELFEIHEKMPILLSGTVIDTVAVEQKNLGFTSSIWLIYLSPIIFGGIFTLILFLKTLIRRYRWLVSALIIAFLFYVSSFLLEFVGTETSTFFSENYENIMIIEEFMEMLASSLLIVFVIGIIIKNKFIKHDIEVSESN